MFAKHDQFSWLLSAKLQAPHPDFQVIAQVRGVFQQRSATADAAGDVSHFVVFQTFVKILEKSWCGGLRSCCCLVEFKKSIDFDGDNLGLPSSASSSSFLTLRSAPVSGNHSLVVSSGKTRPSMAGHPLAI